MPRRPNYRKVRSHQVYTVAEAAEVLGAHRQTVRRWVRACGLPAAIDQKPWLIAGKDLKHFLEARSRASKCPLGPEEFYCLPCRTRRQPDGALADYRPKSPTVGMLGGLCPACGRLMHRTIRRADLGRLTPNLEIAFPMADAGISSSATPTVNVHIHEEAETHAKAQR